MIPNYPLQWPAGWPRTKSPITSRFGKHYSKPSIATGVDLVQEEVRRLGGKNIVDMFQKINNAWEKAKSLNGW